MFFIVLIVDIVMTEAMNISDKTITRELVPKKSHEADAICDLAKQIYIFNGNRTPFMAFEDAKAFYEYREQAYNELIGNK